MHVTLFAMTSVVKSLVTVKSLSPSKPPSFYAPCSTWQERIPYSATHLLMHSTLLRTFQWYWHFAPRLRYTLASPSVLETSLLMHCKLTITCTVCDKQVMTWHITQTVRNVVPISGGLSYMNLRYLLVFLELERSVRIYSSRQPDRVQNQRNSLRKF